MANMGIFVWTDHQLALLWWWLSTVKLQSPLDSGLGPGTAGYGKHCYCPSIEHVLNYLLQSWSSGTEAAFSESSVFPSFPWLQNWSIFKKFHLWSCFQRLAFSVALSTMDVKQTPKTQLNFTVLTWKCGVSLSGVLFGYNSKYFVPEQLESSTHILFAIFNLYISHWWFEHLCWLSCIFRTQWLCMQVSHYFVVPYCFSFATPLMDTWSQKALFGYVFFPLVPLPALHCCL